MAKGAQEITALSEQLARRALRSGPEKPPVAIDWGDSTANDVASAFQILAEHRLDLVVYTRLTDDERLAHLSAALREELETVLRKTRNHQGLLELAFAQVTHALHEAGLAPIACKGIVLAQDYYTPKGVRPMQDIDLWIVHGSLERVRPVLQQVGFRERPEKETHHALYFANPMGILLDVHHHMALFEDQGLLPFDLTQPARSGWHRVFTPEALLVHLVFHLLGHTRQVAVLLGWVLDLSLVVEKHRAEIDWQVVRQLCPTERVYKILLRLLALADDLGWCEAPAPLQTELRKLAPISYATLVRLRHLAPLDLTSPRGWARLIKRFRPQEQPLPPLPPWSELPLGLTELFAEATRFRLTDCGLLTGEEAHHH